MTANPIIWAQQPAVAAPPASPSRDRAIQMAALLMGRVRAMPIRTDTRIPMMKGCISVAVFTRFPNQFMNWATPGPTNWATSTPEIMVMPGVTMMSRRVSLDTILPNSDRSIWCDSQAVLVVKTICLNFSTQFCRPQRRADALSDGG